MKENSMRTELPGLCCCLIACCVSGLQGFMEGAGKGGVLVVATGTVATLGPLSPLVSHDFDRALGAVLLMCAEYDSRARVRE